MSRDKQIEEVANFVYADPYETYNWRDAVCLATDLYNAGYRKSSDVAEEIFADLDEALGKFAMKYSDEGFNEYFGVCEEIFTKVIYPIKKKYTEEGE